MSDTPCLGLPLLQPSQAQKHVTVNEAMIRIDGMAQLRLQSRLTDTPPALPEDGNCYAIPAGANGDWAGRDGRIAISSNGGWVYVEAGSGWSGWIVDEMARAVFDGETWRQDVVALGQSGAASRMVVDESEYTLLPGGAQEVQLEIPSDAMVFACSARVVEDIEGTLASWSLGVSGEVRKFGSGMGKLHGSYCTGILSQPTTYYSATKLLLTPVGGDFESGRLRLALHSFQIDLPTVD